MEGRIPQGTITCERSNQAQTATSQQRGAAPQSVYSSRMDSVIHHVTTLPAMKSLLSVTHHDYLPNEYDAVVLESDDEMKLVRQHSVFRRSSTAWRNCGVGECSD